MLAAYYSVAKEWLTERLYTTVYEVFAEHTRIYRLHQEPFLFNTVIMGATGIESFREDEAATLYYGQGIASTDDWPYIYLERRTIAPIYLKLSAVMLAVLVGVFVLLRRLHRPRAFT